MSGLTPEQLLLLIAGLPILIASLVAWMTHRVLDSEEESETASGSERSSPSVRPMAEQPVDDRPPLRGQEPKSTN